MNEEILNLLGYYCQGNVWYKRGERFDIMLPTKPDVNQIVIEAIMELGTYKKEKDIMIVKQAFNHVGNKVKGLKLVVYDENLRWYYITEDREIVSFEGMGIDVSLLEEAAEYVASNFQLPQVFEL